MNLKLLEQVTKLNEESQNKNLRLFSKIDIATKLKILKKQKVFFHQLKSKHKDIDNAILTLSSLVLTVDTFTKELDEVNLNAIKLRGKNNKAKIKRQKLLSYWAIVKRLKTEENFSFRRISGYLKKYHKFEVSYSLIYQKWNELEKK